MSFAELPKEALVVGGYSESAESDEALVNAITDPHEGIVRDATFLTAQHFYENIDDYPCDELLLFTRSGGIIPARTAAAVIAFNGPEPTSGFGLARGAIRGVMRKIPFEEQVRPDAASLRYVARQLREDRLSFWLPRAVLGGYSTATRLGFNPKDFPGGRMMIHCQDDCFGFNQPWAMDLAQKHGVIVSEVEGIHGSPLYQPKRFVAHIRELIEKANS